MLKEYLRPLTVVATVALGMGLFIGGCHIGKVKEEVKVVELEGKVSSLESANRRFVEVEEYRTALLLEAQQRAAEWKKAAEAADSRVADARQEKDKAQRAAIQALANATKDPDCEELLRRQVCEVVPLP